MKHTTDADRVIFRFNDNFFMNPPFCLHWSTLRHFGENHVVRSSYFWLAFVPIAVRALQQFNVPVQKLIFGPHHAPVWPQLPFSWYYFYFAAVAFSLATLLYSAFCPEIVKKFTSPIDFYKAGHGGLKLLEYFSSLAGANRAAIFPMMLRTAAKNQRPALTEPDYTVSKIQAIPEIPEREEKLSSLLLNIEREQMNDAFTAIYDHFDIKRWGLRLIITIFNYLGLFFTAYVAVQSFGFVINTFLSRAH